MISLTEVSAQGEWIDALPEYQRQTIATMLQQMDPLEAADAWLQASGPRDTAPFGAGTSRVNIFLLNLMRELQKLTCTEEGYEAEKKQVLSAAQLGQPAVIAAVATALAPHVGAAAVVIAPAIGLLLSVFYNAAVSTGCDALSRKISELESAGGM